MKKPLTWSYTCYCTMMLLIGIWISLTKKPMNPMIAKPMAVARAIFWNSKKLTGSFSRPLTLSTRSNRDILKNKSLFKWGLKWILKTLFQAFADPLHHLLWWCHRPAKAWNRGFAPQPYWMAGQWKLFAWERTFVPTGKRIYCSCHPTWLPCKTSIKV